MFRGSGTVFKPLRRGSSCSGRLRIKSSNHVCLRLRSFSLWFEGTMCLLFFFDQHISSSSPVIHLVLMCSVESVQCWHKCVKCFSTKYEKSIVSLDEKIIEDHNTFHLRITQKWDSDQLHWHQNLVFHVPSRDPMLRKFKCDHQSANTTASDLTSTQHHGHAFAASRGSSRYWLS